MVELEWINLADIDTNELRVRRRHGWVIEGTAIGYPAYRCNLYWVQLDRCRSAAGALQMITHVARKRWATRPCIVGLINTLDEVLEIYSLR